MTDEHPTYNNRIVTDPEILVGKPTVRGTRIPVELVLEYLERNPNFDDLFADYPRLTMDDVKACLAFARYADQLGQFIVVTETTIRVRHQQ
jgi:uncharacterized protein (DUF433 family)